MSESRHCARCFKDSEAWDLKLVLRWPHDTGELVCRECIDNPRVVHVDE